ncbi:hypothetical protein E8E14_008225 [Neopestalotiopsis sp. 37M]|nr:hypothetical protein E8E14_008225 [Neopestalotiopsis sp. 37M]
MKQNLELLSDETPPDGAIKSELTKAQHVEVYGFGALRAVIVVEVKNDKHVIKSSWLSSQDADLARQLIEVVRQRYSIPGKGLLFHADHSQPAIMEEAKGLPVRAQIMSKKVDPNVRLPQGTTYRDMTTTEAVDYFRKVEDEFVDGLLKIKPENETEKDVRDRAHAMVASIAPNGPETPGQKFLVIEDAGAATSTLWIGERGGRQSFCYDIQVHLDKRGLGHGRKALLVWEHAAAGLGLVSLGLNVFGSNIPALKLYTGGGFLIDDATFILDDQVRGS